MARRIVDGAVLHLIKMWLEAPVEETDEKGNKHRSTPNRDEGKGTRARGSDQPVAKQLVPKHKVMSGTKRFSRASLHNVLGLIRLSRRPRHLPWATS